MTRLLLKTLKILRNSSILRLKYNVLCTTRFINVHDILLKPRLIVFFTKWYKMWHKFEYKISTWSFKRKKNAGKTTLQCELFGQLWCNINSILQPTQLRVGYALCMASQTCSYSWLSGLTLWVYPDHWRN